MRKHFLFLVLCAMMCVTALQAQNTQYAWQTGLFMWHEGFEGGVLPTGWTQSDATGNATWIVEDVNTATYPSHVYAGTYRASVKNPGNLFGASVRLVSPTFDLSTVTGPHLTFALASQATGVGVDTLRVYYRVANSQEWHLLETCAAPTSGNTWRKYDLNLIANTNQLAFEYKDGSGRGMGLDDIKILNTAVCEGISNVQVTPESTTAEVAWSGSFMADHFEYVLANAPLANDSIDANNPAVLNAGETTEFSYTFTGLTPDQTYYLYLRSTCDDNETGYTTWVVSEVVTYSQVALPYAENFNSVTTNAMLQGWTRGTDLSSTNVPFVNGAVTSKYYYSVDSTAALCFSTNSMGTITVGKYAYAVTPLINTADLSQIEVSFWGTAYTHTANTKGAHLYVGTMTNPKQVETFHLIDSVTVDASYQFKHFTVAFDNYVDGNGRYIAFLSPAGKENLFTIDNLNIQTTTIFVPTDVQVSGLHKQGFNLSANLHGAQAYNVRVYDAGEYVEGGALPTATPLVSLNNQVGSITVNDAALLGQTVIVYVQAANGSATSAWAHPVVVRMPQVISEVPTTWGFEDAEGTMPLKSLVKEIHYGLTTNVPSTYWAPTPSVLTNYPASSTSRKHTGNKSLNLAEGTYIVLGEVDADFANLQIELYVSGSVGSKLEVGVISDPLSFGTFANLQTIDITSAASTLHREIIPLDGYTGNNKFVALYNAGTSALYIDDVQLMNLPSCREPKNVHVEDLHATSATIVWDGLGMSEWVVRLYAGTTASGQPIADLSVNTASAAITGLTPATEYSYIVETVCGTDTTDSEKVFTFQTPVELPFSQNFDAGTTVPALWTRMTGLASAAFAGTAPSSSSSGWTFTSSNLPVGMSGNRTKVNIYGTSCNYWLVTPELLISAEAGQPVALTFDAAWTKYNNTSAPVLPVDDDKFMVLISTDGGESWNRNNATIWTNDTTGDYLMTDIQPTATPISIDLSQYVGQLIKIAFYGESTVSGGDNDFSIDNVKVAVVDETCMGLSSLNAIASSSTEASISWVAGGSPENMSVVVEVSTDATFATTVYSQTTSDNPILLTDLTEQTMYYVRARQACDIHADWREVRFLTPCSAVASPLTYSENFASANDFMCWKTGFVTSGSSAASAYATRTTVTGFGYVLRLSKDAVNTTSTTYSDGAYAVMPQLGTDSIASYQVTFDAATNSTAKTNRAALKVGVATDPNDMSTFTEVQTLGIGYAADSTQMDGYSVSFAAYEGDYNGDMGRYIVFLSEAGSDSINNVLIDNIRIEPVSSCPAVVNLRVDSIEATTAYLKWDNTGAAEYQVALFGSRQSAVNAAGASLVYSATANHITLTSLTPNTSYFAYVRAICAAGDSANWSNPTNFRTECVAISELPWSEDFNTLTEGIPSCWDNSEGTTSTANYKWNYNASGATGACLRFDSYSNSSGNTNILYTQPIALSEAAIVTFKYKNSAGGNFGVLVQDVATMKIDTLSFGMTGVTSWTSYEFNLSTYVGKQIKIGFLGVSNWGSGDAYLYLDDVSLDIVPECMRASNLVVDSISGGTAAIHWLGDSTKNYIVEVSKQNTFSVYDSIVVVADTKATLTNLESGRTYYVRIKTVCDDEITEPSVVLTLTTECQTITRFPWSEDFNALSSGIPACWDNTEGTTSSSSYKWSYYAYGASGAGLRFDSYNNLTGNTNYLATPPMTLEAGMELTFNCKNPDGGAFAVQISYDGGNTKRTLLSTGLQGLQTWTKKTVNLSAYADSTVIIYFVGTSNYGYGDAYLYLDDVSVRKVPTCFPPTNLHIVDSLTNTTSITLGWTANGAVEDYRIEILSGVDTVASASVHGTYYTVTGLQPSTMYLWNIKVYTDCGDELSADALAVTGAVQTDCVPIDGAWAENFESAPAGLLPACWARGTSSDYPYVYPSTYATSGNNVLYFYGGSTSTAQMAVLPEVGVGLDTMELAFSYKYNSATASYGHLIVGYLTDAHRANSFVALDTLEKSSTTTLANVALTNVPDSVSRLAILFTGGTSSTYVYVDDMSISRIPLNKTLGSVVAENVANRTMDITWKHYGQALCSDYELVISKVALADSLLDSTEKVLVHGEQTYHATKLDRGTQYYIYVRTACPTTDGPALWVSTTATTKVPSLQIGEGTATAYLLYPSYGNAYTQHIYTAAELQAVGMKPGVVSSVAFQYSGTSSIYNPTQTLYIGHTTLSSFAGTSVNDIVDPVTLTAVYGASQNSYEAGWRTYDFVTPFVWDGVSNIVVAMLSNTGGTSTSGWSAAGTTTSGVNRTFYCYRDNTEIDPADLSSVTSKYRGTSRPNIRFGGTMDLCPSVDTIMATSGSDVQHSMVLTWSEGTGDYAGTYDVYYSETPVVAFDSIVPQITNIDTLSVEVTGLEPFTVYYAYVRSNCDAEGRNEGQSGWVGTSFRTKANCTLIENVAVVLTDKNAAELSWDAVEDGTVQYVLSQTELSETDLNAATWITAEGSTVSLSNLLYETTYYIYVAHNCGGGMISTAEMVTISTDAECAAVRNLHAINVAFNMIEVAWDPSAFGSETEWEVGIVGDAASLMHVQSPVALLIGLDQETTYTVYVKSICGETSESPAATLTFTTTVAPGDVTTIGDGTSTSYSLITSNWGSSYSQVIYTAEELTNMGLQPGNILSMAFDYAGASSTYTKTQTLYVGTTSLNTYAAVADLVDVNELTVVYGPELRTYASGWQTYAFDAPFYWDGSSNLVVAMLTNGTTSASTSSAGWDVYATAIDDQCIRFYKDNTIMDPADMTTMNTGYVTDYRPNIRIEQFLPGCHSVNRVNVDSVTTTEATLSWQPAGSEVSWAITLSDHALSESDLNASAVAKDTLTRVLTKTYAGLTPDADYYFYIRSLCSATDASAWKEVIFHTVPTCMAPTDIEVTSLSATNAVLTWNSANASFAGDYVVAYGLASAFNLADSTTYETVVATADSIALTGLAPQTAYAVAVAARCDETDMSSYSQAIVFMTECVSVTTFPWSEDFEKYAAGDFDEICWNNMPYRAGTGTYGSTGLVFKVDTYGNGDNTTHQLYLPDQLEGTLTRLYLPTMHIDAANAYEFKMDVYRTSSYTYSNEGIRVYVVGEDGSETALAFIPRNIMYSSGVVPAEAASDWYTYSFTIPVSGDIRIMLQGESQYGAATYMDNMLVRELPTCTAPADIQLQSVGTDSVTLRWTGDNSATAQLIYSTNSNYANADTVLVTGANQVTLNGLMHSSQYYVMMRYICGTEYSDPATFQFMTNCDAISIFPWAEDFEGFATGVLDNACWSNEHVSGSGSNYFQVSMTTYGNNASQKLYLPDMTGGTLTRLTTPLLKMDTTKLYQLSFDIYRGHSTYNANSPLEGIRFFVEKNGIETELCFASRQYDSQEGAPLIPAEQVQDIWYTYTVTIPVKGDVHLILQGESQYCTATYLDNLLVEEINASCIGISNMAVSYVTINDALLSFNYQGGSTDAYIEVSTDAAFANVVLSDNIVNDSTYYITGLQPSTTYYVRAKQLCGANGESAYTRTLTFATPMGVPYSSNFTSTTLPSDWSRASALADDVFAGNAQLTSTTGGWSLIAADTVIASTHFRGNVYGTSWHNWVITPTIDLSQTNGQGVVLTFDAGMTAYSSSGSANRNAGVDDRFIVVVSEDAGVTWTRANATIWDNTGAGDYVYNDLPENGATYRINLSKYIGKSVKIAFYGESSLSNADNYVHFGNIALTTCPAVMYTEETCAGEPFYDDHFAITADQIHVGTNQFATVETDAETGTETVYLLSLTVNPVSIHHDAKTYCEGEVISDYGINLIASASRTFNVILPGAAANGCDSIVVLDVTVIPAAHTEIHETICEGEAYSFNGENLYVAGVYVATFSTESEYHCDSIVTLFLEVSQKVQETIDEQVCFGETYTFNGQTLNASGTYTATFTSVIGCDSIVTLNLTIMPEAKETVVLNMTAGETYTDDHFVGVVCPGTYTAVTKNELGCDSTITLILQDPTGLELLSNGQLRLTPNPVAPSQLISISSTNGMDGAQVIIYDAVGHMVSRETLEGTTIVAPEAQGMYMVTIKRGNETYVGKLLVQ